MERVDERLLQQLRVDMDRGHAKDDRTVQLLYYLHMNASLLTSLSKRIGPDMAQEVERLTEANYQFAMDASHAIVFLGSDVKRERYEHLDGTTRKLRRKIDRLPTDEVSVEEDTKTSW